MSLLCPPVRPLLTVLAALVAGVAATAQAQTTLALSSWVPPSHTLSEVQKEWCSLLEQKAAGKVKCNVLPRAVSAPPGTYDAIKNGLADVSFTVHGYTPGRFVAVQMAEFPFLGNTSEPISVAFNKVASKYPHFAGEHAGVKVLAYFTHGPGIVFNTKKAVTQVADLGGLKFRVGGGMVNEISKALNMNVTLKPATDSYELLSSGVMDGTLFPAESTDSFKIDKIIKHATTFPGGLYNTSFVFMMNPAKYDKLTADEKKAIDAISGDTVASMFGKSWDRVDAAAHQSMQKNGVVVTKANPALISEVTVRINKLERDWASAAEAKGLKNAGSVLAEFRSEIASLQK